MKLLIASKALINSELTNHFLDFVGTNRNAAIITTAAQTYKERNRNHVALKEKLLELDFQVEFIDLEFEPPEKLLQFNVIIIGGGNPYYLLHHLQRSRADKLLKKIIERDIPVMGISAGGLVLTQDLAIIDLLTPEMNAEVNLQDKRGLGLIAEVIVPHYDRFVAVGIIDKKVVDKFERQTSQRVIRLGEYQAIVYTNQGSLILGDLIK